MEVPYTVDPRPDTRLYNAQLGMWLFIASEVMLFGAVFSAYALLRTGADEWPIGRQHLDAALGGLNTVLLIVSSAAIAMGVRALRGGAWQRGRVLLGTTCALGLAFLAIKAFEYREHVAAGELPSTNNFFAVYYTLTALHALHVVGGLVVLAYLVGTGRAMWRTQPDRLTHRAAAVSVYWQFVDVIWILVFVTVYLV